MVVSTVGGIIAYWEIFITFKILPLSPSYECPIYSSRSWGLLGREVGSRRHISGLSSKHSALAFWGSARVRSHVAILVPFTGNGYYRFSPSPVAGSQKWEELLWGSPVKENIQSICRQTGMVCLTENTNTQYVLPKSVPIASRIIALLFPAVIPTKPWK